MAKKTKHRFNRDWMNRHVNDGYVKRARKEGFRARSVYKLDEIDRKDRMIRPGMNVVDLGAAPGGWCQYVSGVQAGKGRLIAIDRLPMDDIEGVDILQGDFTEAETQHRIDELLAGQKLDLVLSDMAPNLTGIPAVDQARSVGIAEEVLYWCLPRLVEGGSLLIKVFQGSGFDQLRAEMLNHFRSVAVRKPGASRSRSAEVYLLARGFTGG